MQHPMYQKTPEGFEDEIIIPCESGESYKYFEPMNHHRDLKVKLYKKELVKNRHGYNLYENPAFFR